MSKRAILLFATGTIASLVALMAASEVIQSIQWTLSRAQQQSRDPGPFWWLLPRTLPFVAITATGSLATLVAWRSNRIPGAAALLGIIAFFWFNSDIYRPLRVLKWMDLRTQGLFNVMMVVTAFTLAIAFGLLLRFTEQQRAHHDPERASLITSRWWFWVGILGASGLHHLLGTVVLKDISNTVRASVGAPPAKTAADFWLMVGPIFMNPVGIARNVFMFFGFGLVALITVFSGHNLLRAYVAAEGKERVRVGWFLVALQFWTLITLLTVFDYFTRSSFLRLGMLFYGWQKLALYLVLSLAAYTAAAKNAPGSTRTVRAVASTGFAAICAMILLAGTAEAFGTGVAFVVALGLAWIIRAFILRTAHRAVAQLSSETAS